MEHGICKLCNKVRDLCKSHYMPRALFVHCGDDTLSPIVLTEKLILSTDRQVSAPLLCSACEQLFSKKGEEYTMTMVQRNSGRFTLLEILNAAKRCRPEGEFVAYFGRQLPVDTDALAYFALSVAWRGAVHDWPTLGGQTTGVSLGQYLEPLRQYLLGEIAVPDGVFVAVIAASDFGSRNHVFFPSQTKNVPFTCISMLALGIWFDIFLGSDLPFELRRRCCVTSAKRPIFKADCDTRTFPAAKRLHKMARVAKNVSN